MRYALALASLICTISVAGCVCAPSTRTESQRAREAARQDGFDYPSLEPLSVAQRQAIPLPESTPYDQDKNLRSAYLNGFQSGYELGRFMSSRIILPAEEHRETKQIEDAWWTGLRDGRTEGRRR